MATIYHKGTAVDGIFKIGISQNTKCEKSVGFPKSGHNLCYEFPRVDRSLTLSIIHVLEYHFHTTVKRNCRIAFDVSIKY